MKWYFLAFFVFFFGVAVVSLSIWRSRPPLVTLAAEEGSMSMEAGVEREEIAATGKADDYPLPYPGLLPDHPLYFLKMIRDRVQLWFTRDTLARAELMLQIADKRFAAALTLAEKGKVGLAASTAKKAVGYFEQALGEAERASLEGKDTDSFYEKALRASEKHEQVLIGVLSRVPNEVSSVVEEALQNSRLGRERVKQVTGEDDEQTSEDGEQGEPSLDSQEDDDQDDEEDLVSEESKTEE